MSDSTGRTSPEGSVDFLQRGIETDPSAIAIIDRRWQWTYADLERSSRNVAGRLTAGRGALDEARVAYLLSPGMDYAAAYIGVLRAGGINVPLCHQHPPPELAYVIGDSDPEFVIVDPESRSKVESAIDLARKDGWAPTGSFQLLEYGSIREYGGELPDVPASTAGMMVYTSGTTGKPKGVVTTHAANFIQACCLRDAWGWSSSDRLLHVLPLHHVHGIVNGFLGALAAGASLRFLEKFDAGLVWESLADGDITVFYAVPTIYTRLIAHFDGLPKQQRSKLSEAVSRLRLMVSGSAALPAPVLERWKEITSHVLLERYGMTEIGMALSNPYEGRRRISCVGAPLPGVRVRLVNEQGATPTEGEHGEIQVAGPSLFREYWRRPDATAESFEGKWFKTGDVAVMDDGAFRIMGRNSVDIIKTGGYKVSALEIENVLITHESIKEVAVVGMEDDTWGEAVTAAVVPQGDDPLDLPALRDWAKLRMADYKAPQRLEIFEQLPRNAMGKVGKPKILDEIRLRS
jgi:malonyl-CoA/methylmalonyl-CoA synthetase